MTDTAKWSDFVSLDGPRTLAAANQLLPAWVSLLLVVVIGWQLASMLWNVMPAPAAGDAVSIPAGSGPGSTSGTGRPDVEFIAESKLFGELEPEEAAPETVAAPASDEFDDLEETRQNLTLKGIVAATDPDMSAAIIEDASNDETTYQIGDAIASGISLHAVFPLRVVLNENGRFTNLELPAEFAQTRAPVRRTTRPVQQRASETQSIQSVVASNVSRLADVIRPTPYFVNGQQQGYRVYPGRDRRQFAALGLRPGDLIKDIDGQALSDPTQAMKIFQELGTADQVSVTIERDGQPQSLVLKTSQLDLSDEDTQ